MGKKKGKEPAAKPLDPELLDAIVCIKSDSTTTDSKLLALRKIGAAACGKDCVRMDLVKDGILEPLLHLLDNGVPREKEMATYALRHLSAGNFLQIAYDNPTAIVMVGGARLLVGLLASGETDVQKEHAAACLCNLASKTDNRTALLQQGAIPALLAAIRNDSEFVAIQAAFALGSIAFSHPENRKAIRAAEGLEALTGLARRFPESSKIQQVTQYALHNVNEPVPVETPSTDPAASPPDPPAKKK